MIRATNLGRRFGEQWAVRGVNLEVAPGEVLGLLGPNGAGKTTTVRLLTALIEPTEGDASLGGHDVRHEADDVRARVGVLTETPGLYERLSAWRNLEFFGQLHRLPIVTRHVRIERLLRLFDLWDRRNEPTGTFSKGMKQKLAIARALLHEPDALFLDEPTAALDPETAFIVRDAIARLRAEGRTIVLATHNLDEANRLCDRIAFVRGQILRVDSPARLRGALTGRGVEVSLAEPVDERVVEAARRATGVASVEIAAGLLTVGVADPRRDTPGLIRDLVAAGAAILEVRERAATLEQVYFDVMGDRPESDAGMAGPVGDPGQGDRGHGGDEEAA